MNQFFLFDDFVIYKMFKFSDMFIYFFFCQFVYFFYKVEIFFGGKIIYQEIFVNESFCYIFLFFILVYIDVFDMYIVFVGFQ